MVDLLPWISSVTALVSECSPVYRLLRWQNTTKSLMWKVVGMWVGNLESSMHTGAEQMNKWMRAGFFTVGEWSKSKQMEGKNEPCDTGERQKC